MNPNDPNATYQTEYRGKVGHEKKDHQTHFAGLDIQLADHIPVEDDPNYVKNGAGRWIRIWGQKRITADA